MTQQDHRLIKAYGLAKTHVGLREIPGAEHNPKIVQMFKDVGHEWVKDDETSWCAAFVGSMLKRSGVKGTEKLNARSYKDWGDPVDLKDAKHGDIVVFWRESPTSWKGHVGFYAGRDGLHIEVLGGNQSNEVNVQSYPVSRLLAVRRLTAPEKQNALALFLSRLFGGH